MQLPFAAGDTSFVGCFDIGIISDDDFEGDEMFTVGVTATDQPTLSGQINLTPQTYIIRDPEGSI